MDTIVIFMFALSIIILFFLSAYVGAIFLYFLLLHACSRVLRQVIVIEFWILFVSLLILSDQVHAPIDLPFIGPMPFGPYWLHVVIAFAVIGLTTTIFATAIYIFMRIKFGKDVTVFNVKV
jgi:hypothetical protein